jgi:hypothetical protein
MEVQWYTRSLGIQINEKYETKSLHGWLMEVTPVVVAARLQLSVEVVDRRATWK